MSKGKILIVEDEGIEALDIQGSLISLGYAADHIAATGEEAVSRAAETAPDLVLMDIMLQGAIDGITAAEQIRVGLEIPVVYLTAYADEQTLQRAKITEPYGYLVKPFKERELHIAIDMALYKHQMEQKLKENEKWFSTTLRSIGDAAIATDKSGFITFMNAVAEDLMGWRLDEVLTKKLTDVFTIINRDTRQPVENPVSRVLLEGITMGLANHTLLIAKDGTEIPIDDSAAPIKDERGNIMGVILVFRDITERERAEEALKKMHHELEIRVQERTAQVQKLNDELEDRVRERTRQLESANNDLESFTYSVSHDLRSPLRAIDGFSRMLSAKYKDQLDAEGQRLLNVIRSNTQGMSQLINDLLAFARLGRQKIELCEVDMRDLAETVYNEIKASISGRSIAFALLDPPPARADKALIRQVLVNLLSNGVKFTHPRTDAMIEFGGTVDGNENIYFVKDNGVGFDMGYAEKIFGVFQRLHSAEEFEGTGVGLSIVQRTVLMHGGRVWAEGKIDEGATFYFTLPK